MRECGQVKCGFHPSQGVGGCPECDSCGASPHLVDDQCDKCWNCEHDDGVLRGSPETRKKEELEVKNHA